MSFTFAGHPFDLFDHPYNTTRLNERAVEVPIANAFIERWGLDLEVGNVLSHYGFTGHRIVDRYEEAPGVENLDVFALTEPVNSCVTISTLEHVRWDEPDRDPFGAVAALQHLRHLADHLLVTVPMGHNPELDGWLLGDTGATQARTLVRFGTGWRETRKPEWRPYALTTKWAESVFVGEWHA